MNDSIVLGLICLVTSPWGKGGILLINVVIVKGFPITELVSAGRRIAEAHTHNGNPESPQSRFASLLREV